MYFWLREMLTHKPHRPSFFSLSKRREKIRKLTKNEWSGRNENKISKMYDCVGFWYLVNWIIYYSSAHQHEYETKRTTHTHTDTPLIIFFLRRLWSSINAIIQYTHILLLWLLGSLLLFFLLLLLFQVQVTLKQIARDWSVDGEEERQQCYKPIIDEIEQFYKSDEMYVNETRE